jgi:hypothetical protein
MLGTVLCTPAAVYTKMSFEGYFRFLLPGFDVLTPGTAQGATLEKNQASYAGTIMKTEMLDGKDEWLNRSHVSSAR